MHIPVNRRIFCICQPWNNDLVQCKYLVDKFSAKTIYCTYIECMVSKTISAHTKPNVFFSFCTFWNLVNRKIFACFGPSDFFLMTYSVLAACTCVLYGLCNSLSKKYTVKGCVFDCVHMLMNRHFGLLQMRPYQFTPISHQVAK